MALYYLYKLVDVAPSVKGAHGDYISEAGRPVTGVDLIVSSNGQIVKDRQGFLYGQENFKSEELRNL